MSDEVAYELADEIIAESKGQANKTKLARWHRKGLTPSPIGRKFLGRGKGSATLYPVGTKAQVLRLCELFRHDRRVAHAFWQLWREKFPVPIKPVRDFLDEIAEMFDSAVAMLRTGDELSEQAWNYLDKVDDARLAPALRRTRKRVGRGRFPTLMRILTETATGTFQGWSPDTGADDVSDREILEKGAGLDRARRDRTATAGPWLTGDTENELKQFSNSFNSISLKQELADTTDAELVEARDELNTLLSVLGGASILGEGLLGRGAFGLGLIQELQDVPALGHGFLLLLWLIIRRQQTVSEGCKILVSQSGEWPPQVTSSQALQQLRAEIPGVATLISYRRCRIALRNPKAMEQLQHEIEEFAAAHKDEIRAFFARHPGYQAIKNINQSNS